MLQPIGESIWAHEQRIHFGCLPMWHRMCVIRLASGGVVVHSPTRLTRDEASQIQALGPVVAIVAPSWWHDLYLRETQKAFPDATLYLAAALRAEGALAPWELELQRCPIRGIGLFIDEIVFYHAASRSIIVADLLFNFSASDAPITRWLANYVIGPYPGCRFARLYRPFVFDRQRFRASIDKVLRWDFDRIVVGHGAVVESNGAEVFRKAFEWLDVR